MITTMQRIYKVSFKALIDENFLSVVLALGDAR